MRPAKEILYAKATENHDGFMAGQVKWLHEAMLEFAKEVLTEAAGRSAIIYHDGFNKVNKSVKYFQSGADNLQPDKQAILSLINELK